jgi:hypothetical protein
MHVGEIVPTQSGLCALVGTCQVQTYVTERAECIRWDSDNEISRHFASLEMRWQDGTACSCWRLETPQDELGTWLCSATMPSPSTRSAEAFSSSGSNAVKKLRVCEPRVPVSSMWLHERALPYTGPKVRIDSVLPTKPQIRETVALSRLKMVIHALLICSRTSGLWC